MHLLARSESASKSAGAIEHLHAVGGKELSPLAVLAEGGALGVEAAQRDAAGLTADGAAPVLREIHAAQPGKPFSEGYDEPLARASASHERPLAPSPMNIPIDGSSVQKAMKLSAWDAGAPIDSMTANSAWKAAKRLKVVSAPL